MNYFLYHLLFFVAFCYLVTCRDHPDVLNTCFDANYHKATPGPEPRLYGQCSPWKSRACCKPNRTIAIQQEDKWGGFSWNHCPGHNMSENCVNWFLKDECFYECSPNTGPWITPHNISSRNERFLHAPLCASQCNMWWQACKNEYTCLDNWGKGFNWTKGVNTCPVGHKCQTFSQIFNNDATTFCNKIWDYSWKVVPDTQSCMKIDFNGTNPNDAVAKHYASINAAGRNAFSDFLMLIATVTVYCIYLI